MKKQVSDVIEVYAAENELGEGPLWLNHSNSLCWVDIQKYKVFEYALNTKQVKSWNIDRHVSLLIETDKKDTLLIGVKGGIALLNMKTNEVLELVSLEEENENSRTNDGGCDPNGNLWIGTLDMDFEEDAGALYMLEGSTFQKKIPNATIANGLVWSKDGRTMYFIDSPKGSVQAFVYDGADNSIEFQKDVITIPKKLGGPDGMAIDEEGMLWIAHYGGYSVGRWNPNTEEMLEEVEIPAPNITACTFGGKDLKTLFITTARQELTDDELKDFPKSGSLFAVETSVRGLEKNIFSLGKNSWVQEKINERS
jgi:sugar lactone lactonase YvrE